MDLTLVLKLLLVLICSNLIFTKHIQKNLKKEDICETEICQKAAKTILDAIDKTQNPCQDFYQYACGGWIAKNPLPADKSNFGTFKQLGDIALEQLKEILEEDDPEDTPEILNGKSMYKHCLKKEDNVELLSKHLDTVGGWPIVKKCKSTSVSLEDLLALTGRRGVNAIVAADINVDLKIASTNILQVDQGNIPLGRDNILDPVKYKDLIEAYRKFIDDSASIIGSSPSDAKIKKEIEELLQFETKLANLTSKPSDRRNYTTLYEKMTINDLQQKTDPDVKVFNWNAYFNNLTHMEFNSSEPVIVSELTYLKNAVKLIQSTNINTVVNYILWSFIKGYAWHAGGKLSDAEFEFKKVQLGLKEEPARWLTCTDHVDGSWGFAIGRSYVAKHFPSDSKHQAEAMIENVHQAFSKRLENVTFLDEPTKAVAEEKSAVMLRLIGYPDWILNDTAQKIYYEDYPNTSSAHLDNMLESTTGRIVQQFKLLRKPVDKKRFYMTPATVNAMYNPSANSITFPAAILQHPFYKSGRPLSMNYGAIGSVVGHEITHGFDDQGSQFDKDGNLKKWWSDSVTQAFIKETKCFIDQYDKYCPSELQNTTKQCLNGRTTQGENIADNGGVEESFLAYKTWLDKNGPENKLPGLEEYSSEQIFFLSYAHVWCSTATPQYISNQILYDPHSVGRYRVIGPLSNSLEFANTFKCSEGPMNRGNDRCKLW